MLQMKLNAKLYRSLTSNQMINKLLNCNKNGKALVKVQRDTLTSLSNKKTALNKDERTYVCRIYSETYGLEMNAKIVKPHVEITITRLEDISFLKTTC